jgi:predicted O-linked N-acetylglucosamine transferase (SPINDLY family)/predicted SAM-dependent methyltransferase
MLVDRLLDSLLNWTGRFLSRRGHATVAALFFRAGRDTASFEHARVLWQEGDFEAAQERLDSFLAGNPNHAEGNNLAGILALQRGDESAATDYFHRALSVRPAYPAAHNNLGNVHRAQGKYWEAATCYRAALDFDPAYAEALTNLGAVLSSLGNHDEAERFCRQAVAAVPDFAGAHCNLGSALLGLGRGGEAVSAYREAMRLQPGLPEALINLALVLEQPAYLAGVVDYYEEQLKRHPDDYLCHLRVAQALQALGQWDEGRERILKALEIRPQASDALLLLGGSRSHSGDAEGSIEIYRQLVASGRNSAAHSGLVFNLLYVDGITGDALCDECRSWVLLNAPPLGSMHQHRTRIGTTARQLRVGYVSRDFYTHSVAYFLEPILAHHDRSSVFVVCYSTLLQPDAVTEKFKTLADAWRDVSMMPLDDFERMVLEDEIDVLVDLSGHTAGNRLPLFARKPAPVQITYLGHPGTTGLTSIDYRIGDDVSDPPGMTESHYSEKLWRLPGSFLTYKPLDGAPAVTSAPSELKGYVTFGSFNNAMKITGRVMDAWANILQAVPGSIILLKSHAFGTVQGKSRVLDRFANWGIGAERLRLMEWLPGGTDHLSIYSEVDIALDPFPYNGTTTTCEALWMGVPVVTLCGNRHSCRVGSSLLTCLDLPELICDSVDDYIARASELALDTVGLKALRASLRDRMSSSALLDHGGFTRNLETAYRAMWEAWADTADVAVETQAGQAEEMRLHIGGRDKKPGWTVLNINPGPNVDVVGDVRDLSAFRNNSIAVIYASHVLEHVDQQTMHVVLRDIRRILRKPGGRLMISVPDLEVLCRMLLRGDIGAQGRLHVMRMMFGGQVDRHDYHQIGLYFEYLRDLLKSAGFHDIQRVESFGLFDDTSDYAPYGTRISLNVIAAA